MLGFFTALSALLLALLISQLFAFCYREYEKKEYLPFYILMITISLFLCIFYWQSAPAWESELIKTFSNAVLENEKVSNCKYNGENKIVVFFDDEDDWIRKRVKLTSPYINEDLQTTKNKEDVRLVVDIKEYKQKVGGVWVYKNTRQKASNPSEELVKVTIFDPWNGFVVDTKIFTLVYPETKIVRNEVREWITAQIGKE
jgi:hypothetical protein